MEYSPNIRRIAINTGGGDAPGLNAVIRAATLAALDRGWEVFGIRRGYMGLLHDEVDGEPGMMRLCADGVRGITHLGGTILGTTARGNLFGLQPRQPDGTWGPTDPSDDIIRRFGELGIDGYLIRQFNEKPQATAGMINGGFFVCTTRAIWPYLTGGQSEVLELDPMRRLAEDGELVAFTHDGFWQPMDTLREYTMLNEMWESGRAPWRVW